MSLTEVTNGHWRVKRKDPETKQIFVDMHVSQGEYNNAILRSKGNIVTAVHAVTIHSKLYLSKINLPDDYYLKEE